MQRLIDFISQDPPGFHLRWVFFLPVEEIVLFVQFVCHNKYNMNRKHFISAILALTVSAVLMYISLGLSQIRPDTILAPVLAGISMVVMIGVAFASASGPRSIALAVIIAVVAVALAAGVATIFYPRRRNCSFC